MTVKCSKFNKANNKMKKKWKKSTKFKLKTLKANNNKKN